MYGINVVVVF